MLFTQGQLQGYEHMMQEKPVHDCRPIKTMDEKDCKHCLYFDEHCRKCNKEKCTLFNDLQTGNTSKKEIVLADGRLHFKYAVAFLMLKLKEANK